MSIVSNDLFALMFVNGNRFAGDQLPEETFAQIDELRGNAVMKATEIASEISVSMPGLRSNEPEEQ